MSHSPANHTESIMEEPSLVELLQTGLQLLFVGMGIVFLFLSLLVGAVSALPRVLRRIAGEQAFEQVASYTTPAPAKPAIEPDVVEAIQTAIQFYESNQ
ncbi:MAG: sodium pump decarboxylase subunit gamma [Methylococcaceae bacterium]|nr:MAG: sodium pump decarboxylase subunit gamma [Methylococcaceae bacterium]